MTAVDLQVDWNKPDTIREDGRRLFDVRCRVPFKFTMDSAPNLIEAVTKADDAVALTDLSERVIDDSGDGVVLQPGATGDAQDDDGVLFERPTLINGIASSTSIDSYGTEMSLRALKLMAMQMIAAPGIPYLPRHTRGLETIEWDEVIGRTVHAEVVPVEEVRKAHNPVEAQFMLRVSISLYNDEPAAQALIRRVNRGEPIGQSIGGWFTQLQVVQNEDGEVERVIVHGVELDHLAVTRAPANPDSLGLIALRSSLETSARDHRVAALSQHLIAGETICVSPSFVEVLRTTQPLDVRHVITVSDNGDGTVSMKFKVDESEDEESSDRSELSEPPAVESLADEARSLDNPESAAHPAVDSPDVQRSALPPTEQPPLSKDDTPVEEHAMTEQDILALRTAFSDAIAPLAERIDKLSEPVAERSIAEAVEAPAIPTPDLALEARVAAAELLATSAVERATAAEESLARMARSSNRVGRSMVPSFGSGPAARGGFAGLVERARSAAPALAAVAERCIPLATEQDGASSVSRGALTVALRDMLVASENDGIITDPNHRAAWQ